MTYFRNVYQRPDGTWAIPDLWSKRRETADLSAELMVSEHPDYRRVFVLRIKEKGK